MKRKIYKLLSSAKQGLFALALTAFSGTANAQTIYTFSYTGITQTISLAPGNYSFQCWGADGGNASNGSTPMSGGKGGYSSGVFTNTITATYNVYVGGHGGNASGGSNIGGGGGGMSDIAPASNPTMVIIAAGGGGGATSGSSSESSTGGGGGGLTGGNAIDGSGVSTGAAATGGSQSAGGFATAGSYGAGNPGGYGYGGGAANGGLVGVMHGAGGSGGYGGLGGWNGGGGGSNTTSGNEHSGGGGAGYYGGGGGRGDGGAGGGGSGYIGGVSSGTTINFGQSGFVSNPDVAGHGRVIITELCNISLTASGANSVSPIICSGQSLTLTTNAVSNYSWSTGVTGTNQIVVSPTSNTVYGVTGTSSLACTAGANISVTVSPGLPVLTVNSTTNSVCLGDSVTLTASGALSYTWTNGVINGQIFLPTSTVTYTVSGENGCGITTSMTTVSVAPLPVTAISSSTLICASTTATLTGGGANSYTWTIGNQTMQGNSLIVAPDSLSIYTVTGSVGACIGTATITVATKANPTLNITSTSSMVCAGKSVTMTVSGADTYTWNPASLSGTLVVATPTAPILYQVSGTNSLGCTSGTSQVVITNPSPTVNVSANPFIICAGGQATLNATGAHAYSWDTGPTTPVIVVNPNVSTTYTVTGTYTNTGCDANNTVAVTVFDPVLGISASSTVCPGSVVTLTAGSGSGYLWSTGSSFQSITIYPTQSAVYSVSATVTSSNNLNCPATSSVSVGVYPKPTVTAAASRTSMCRGESIDLTAGGADTYLWLNNNSTGGSQTFTSNIIFTHNISVIGTDVNGCTDTAEVAVKVESCTGIEEYLNSSLRLYPNPNNGAFVVESENALEMEISNELGQLIRTISLNAENQQRVHITDLPGGIYFIKGSGKDAIIRHKVIVNK